MEHYYVISGDEFGFDIETKKNFNVTYITIVQKYFDKVKVDSNNFQTILMYVNPDGEESTIDEYCNE